MVYDILADKGYSHVRVNHGDDVFVIGNVHTNTIEGFWAQIKNSIRGVHHGVSPLYLQQYVNEYVFRYNHRKDVTPMFLTLLNRTGLAIG
jgi:transposase